jgi:TolA-binding protein
LTEIFSFVSEEVQVLAFLVVIVAINLTSNINSRVIVGQVTPQQNANMISGRVTDNEHNSISEIRVELLNEVDTVIQVVKTNGSGLFVFRKLSDGTFHIRIQASDKGYVSQTKRVELARPLGFGAASEEVDFVLVAHRNPTEPGKSEVVFVQDVPDQARKLYQRAIQLLQQSDKNQEALSTLRQAIQIYPEYFDALDLMGTELVKQREYEPAIAPLAHAVEVNPKSQSSWFALGVAQYNLKQQSTAVESLRRAVSLKQNSVNANLWLGIALRQTGPMEDAERYLKQADQLSGSKLADAHWQLALLYNQLKRFGEAADQLEMFLKVQPDSRDSENIKKLIKRFREQAAGSTKAP